MNNKLLIIFLAVLLVIPISFAFELNSNDLTRTTCQGNTLLFTANVFGTGSFNVNLDGSASSWSTAVPQGFVLNNNARTIYVYSTPNNNVNSGTYSLNLVVSNSQETKTIPYTINVENCHNLGITGETYKETCKGSITSFIYELTNLGDYEETYRLELEGPNYITLSQDLISLNPGESKNVYAYASQNAETSSFTISAFNPYGIGEITSNLQVNSCYDFGVSTDKDFVNFCEHSTESIVVSVINKGINSDTYNVEIDGPAWANLDSQTLVLGAGQTGNVNLVLSPDYNVKGNFDIDVTVSSSETSEKRTLKAQVNKCHDVFLDIEEKEVLLCNNVKTPLIIKNTGSFEKEYRLETSEQWAGLDNYQVKLKSGEEAIINLILNVDNVEIGNYDVYVRALALDSSELSVNDKLKVKVLEDVQCHNTEIISDSRIKVGQGSSTTLPINIKNNGNEKLIYEISLTGEGSSFTQLNPSILELEGNSGETIYLYSAPSADINSGDYDVEISVSYNNNLLASKSISIEIKESEFTQEEYIPLIVKIGNFFKKLFSKKVVIEDNETLEEEIEEVEEEPEEEIILEEEINQTEDINKTSSLSKLYNKAKPYWLYIVVAIIIIIILIVIFSTGDKDDDEDFFMEENDEDLDEEEEDEEREPLKIGRWIVGIIVVLALIYLQINYGWAGYIAKYAVHLWGWIILYKFYVFIALIILLIIILLIKYWGSILEFFEEEDKPKKKKKK